jgi:Transglycosylase SLT domain
LPIEETAETWQRCYKKEKFAPSVRATSVRCKCANQLPVLAYGPLCRGLLSGGAVFAGLTPMDCWQRLIAAAAKRFGIPAAWIRAVMRAESGGRTTLNGRPITSSTGAMGLMQVMPETYRAMRQRLGLGADPYDPHDNIFAGAAYLRDMYDCFGYPALFAAYNAGPAAFQAYLDGRTSLPDETWHYLATIGLDARNGVLAMHSGGQRLGTIERPRTLEPIDLESGQGLFFIPDGVKMSASRAQKSVPARPDFPSCRTGILVPVTRQSEPRSRPRDSRLFVRLAGHRP